MRLTTPASRRTLSVLFTCLLTVGLFTACGEEPTPTPVPTATPTATATPSPSATATPTPVPTPTATSTPAKAAPDYTEDEIIEASEALFETFLEALHATPFDTEAVNSTYAEACKLPDQELAAALGQLFAVLGEAQLSMAISSVERVAGRDDAVFIVAQLLVNGVPLRDSTPSLTIFENGRWVDADCAAGRDLILTSEIDAPQLPNLPEIVTPGTPAEPALSQDPAEHTDEEIARSLEWVQAEGFRAALTPQPDPERMRSPSIAACSIETEEQMIDLAMQARQAFAGFETIEVRVLGVERIDEDRAWFTGLFAFDGIPDVPTLALSVFEDGHWRDAECLADSNPNLQRPTSIEDDQRIAYVGEPIRVQFDYEEQPFSLTVLGTPEPVDETTVRLPVRVTAVTETLDFFYVTYFGYLETEADAEGASTEWWGEPCEPEVTQGLTLVQGGSIEDFICFSSDPYEAEGQPVPDEPFIRLTSFDGEEFIRVVDLTRSVTPGERQTFRPGYVWGEEPVARIGDTVTAFDCWPPAAYAELTVLQPAELFDEIATRVRVRITVLDSEPLYWLSSVELASGPERYGRVHRWTQLRNASDSSMYPDTLADVTLAASESDEGFLYFEAAASPQADLPAALLYWSECWPRPVHLSR